MSDTAGLVAGRFPFRGAGIIVALRSLVALVGLVGCGFSLDPAVAIDAAAIDAPPVDGMIDAALCTTDPGGPCPPNYVFVPQNCAYGAGEFCIAKYEAKQFGEVAVSQPGDYPWGFVTTADARAACAANGPRYHLVTNDEWMATARAIEATPANWSTTATPFLSKGYTDDCGGCMTPGTPGCPGPAALDNAPCSDTGATQCADRGHADFRFNRTHRILGNGVIWDFSGNMFELIDAPPTTNATEGMHPGISINATTGTAFSPAVADVDYKSANLAHTDVSPRQIPDAAVQNIGLLFATSASSSIVTRGGDYCGFAGIYSVSLLKNSELRENVGFRCAYK